MKTVAAENVIHSLKNWENFGFLRNLKSFLNVSKIGQVDITPPDPRFKVNLITA